ncbi:MAG: CDP-diacylglycerol--glycerol-3-phosphate 3-phosphatidyltransferase [Candidatus Omnitrophica bacterium]|nr:CDP-diacylglycerol--glycerol-3-phosphate 3-phosphatidyltransferase [Candidatus Omnitrophota bacterium]
MKLPNLLTLSRIFLSVLFVFFLFQAGALNKTVALIVFLAAAYTDYLDGYFAKKYGLISNFGKIMDPIADKALTLAAFFSFFSMGLVPFGIVILIAAREIFITAWRLWIMKKGSFLAAEFMGKTKTVSQIAAIIFILLYIISRELASSGSANYKFIEFWKGSIIFVMSYVLFITLFSGISLMWNNRKDFRK